MLFPDDELQRPSFYQRRFRRRCNYQGTGRDDSGNYWLLRGSFFQPGKTRWHAAETPGLFPYQFIGMEARDKLERRDYSNLQKLPQTSRDCLTFNRKIRINPCLTTSYFQHGKIYPAVYWLFAGIVFSNHV